jgi:NADH-quinone oxidoreductase subunit I
MKAYLKNISGGFYSLLSGMRITLEQFFKPVVTVHYPHESLKMTPKFRGHIELVRDPKTGHAICFACKVCEKACPSDCIIVEGAKKEGEKRKSVTEFKLDFTKCSLCGSCVESCKSNALQFSKDYNFVTTSKEELIMDLFKRLENQRIVEEKPASAPAPQPPAEVK